MAVNNKYDGLEVAIIGMSVKFPQSDNYREFWQNLKEGKELLKTFTDEELRQYGVAETAIRDPRYVKIAGVVENKDSFDPGFFGYSAAEAAMMDPQIRVFHQLCWEALEDAGYTSLVDKYRIGLFAGASLNDNWRIHAYGKAADSSIEPFYMNMIIAQRFITTLVSYKLNLRGPSFYVDTACSTSLNAFHLACRSLLTRDCSIALAGGISLKSLKNNKGYFYEEGLVSSIDGHNRTFDADASGTASGEGAAVVVLKKLSEAVKDRDHIYAVIRSTVSNNDGNRKVGYTAPSIKGQVDCIRSAHKLAGIDPRTISYIEAHGTATKMGDPVEIQALNEAFATGGTDKFCAVGSVKSNMGHLDAAAGIAGLVKAALSLKYKFIPPSLHFNRPNPEIDFDNGPFYVNTQLKEWKNKGDVPLRAGVSSFGIGGTNAHVVLEEAPDLPEADQGREYKLLTVSARTKNSVMRYLADLEGFLNTTPDINLPDLSYSLQVGRKHFPYRLSVIYRNREELIGFLNKGKLQEQIIKSRKNNEQVVFMFTGTGSQYIDMGKGLYENEPVFRTEIDKGFELLKTITGKDWKNVLFPDKQDDRRIYDLVCAQPVIFIFEYALARLLMSVGINPDIMVGHSLGEYVAACISGVFSYGDALSLVFKRGELTNILPEGGMVSVPISEEEAKAYTGPEISLAAVNGPEQVVLSGSVDAVNALIDQLGKKGILWTRLHVSRAMHSYMLDNILEDYRRQLHMVSMYTPRMPFVSSLTGDYITDEEAKSVSYWMRHLRETVRFSDAVATLLARNKPTLFIEVGAGNTLTGMVNLRKAAGSTAINMVRHPKEISDDVRYFTERIGQLWARGIDLNWEAWYKNEKRNRVSLPTYSFESEKYLAEVQPFENGLIPTANLTDPAVGQGSKEWVYYPSWKRSVLLNPDVKPQGRQYLLFSFDREFFVSVKDVFLQHGKELIGVFIGEEYKKVSKSEYSIDPAQPDHFKQLVREMTNDGVRVTDIVYTWGIAADASKMKLDGMNRDINLVYFGLVRVVQAFLQNNSLKDKRIAILTDNLHKVVGTEQSAYGQSLLLGLTRVIPQELSIACCNIDLNLKEGMAGMADRLLEEINNNKGKEDSIVALRYGGRWIQDYQQYTQPVQVGKTVIRKDGIYLITGGLGNIGFTLAKYLVQHHGAKVILTGRKELKENEEGWKRLEFLRSMGKGTGYYRIDVSDGDKFNRLVEDLEQTVGKIRGVIHTAGITDDSYFQLLEDMTAEKTLGMFAPKMGGVESLYRIFKDRRPDFVWVTSSLSSVLGGLGYGAYASANTYMDYFISSRSGELPGWKSIGLRGLQFDKKDLGWTDMPDVTDSRADEIYQLFEWSLSVRESPVIFQAREDLPARLKNSYKIEREAPKMEEVDKPDSGRQERPDLPTAYACPETDTEKKINYIFEDFLSMANIGVDDHFFELGGDSLKGMMLLKKINKEFNVNLSLRDFISNATVRLIAARIDETSLLKAEPEMENEITI